MLTLRQLRDQPATREEALEEGRKLLEDAGINTSDWKSGSPELSLLHLWSLLRFSAGQQVAALSKVFTNDATGEALTQLSQSWFQNDRALGVKCVRSLAVSSSAGSGPHSVNAGDIVVADPVNRRFTNIDSLPLPLVGGLTGSVEILRFEAEEEGTAYSNVSNGEWYMVTTFAGVSVAAHDSEAGGSGATSIITAGVDEERDARLAERNSLKWASLAAGENPLERIKQIALKASPTIVDVSVDDENPRGPGTVDVFLAGALEPIAESSDPNSDLQLARSAIQSTFFNGVSRITVVPAARLDFSGTTIPPSGKVTVFHKSMTDDELNTLKADVSDTIDDWIASIPTGGLNIGGTSFGADTNILEEMIRNIDSSVVRCEVEPKVIPLSVNQKLSRLSPSYNITWQEVV